MGEHVIWHKGGYMAEGEKICAEGRRGGEMSASPHPFGHFCVFFTSLAFIFKYMITITPGAHTNTYA